MEDYMNYENLLSSTQSAKENSPAEQARERATQLLEDKKRDILITSEGLSTPMIVEGLRGIGKSAFSKAKSKVEAEGGDTAKAVMNRLDEARGDYEDGGMRRVLTRQVENIKKKLKSKTETEIRKRLGLGSNEEEFKLQNLRNQAEQKARDTYQRARSRVSKDPTLEGTELGDLSTIGEVGGTDLLPSTPPEVSPLVEDSRIEGTDTALEPSEENLIGAKQLPTKDLLDDMTNAQTEGGRIRLPKLEKKLSKAERREALEDRQKKVNEKYNDLSPQDKTDVSNDFRQAKNDTQTFRKSVVDLETQHENEMGMKENIIDNYTDRANQLRQASVEASDTTDTAIDASGAGVSGAGAGAIQASTGTTSASTDATGAGASAGDVDEDGADIEDDATTRALEEGSKDDAKALAEAQAKAEAEKEAAASGERKTGGLVEELGGGPEDPITDIISLIMGGIGLYSGIKASEKAKVNEPPPTIMSNVSNQIGIN